MKRPTLKIERGIPIPSGRPGWARLLRSLKVGESILFPPQDKSTTVRKRASQALGKGCYVCRQVEGGTRVWRTR